MNNGVSLLEDHYEDESSDEQEVDDNEQEMGGDNEGKVEIKDEMMVDDTEAAVVGIFINYMRYFNIILWYIHFTV